MPSRLVRVPINLPPPHCCHHEMRLVLYPSAIQCCDPIWSCMSPMHDRSECTVPPMITWEAPSDCPMFCQDLFLYPSCLVLCTLPPTCTPWNATSLCLAIWSIGPCPQDLFLHLFAFAHLHCCHHVLLVPTDFPMLCMPRQATSSADNFCHETTIATTMFGTHWMSDYLLNLILPSRSISVPIYLVPVFCQHQPTCALTVRPFRLFDQLNTSLKTSFCTCLIAHLHHCHHLLLCTPVATIMLNESCDCPWYPLIVWTVDQFYLGLSPTLTNFKCTTFEPTDSPTIWSTRPCPQDLSATYFLVQLLLCPKVVLHVARGWYHTHWLSDHLIFFDLTLKTCFCTSVPSGIAFYLPFCAPLCSTSLVPNDCPVIWSIWLYPQNMFLYHLPCSVALLSTWLCSIHWIDSIC